MVSISYVCLNIFVFVCSLCVQCVFLLFFCCFRRKLLKSVLNSKQLFIHTFFFHRNSIFFRSISLFLSAFFQFVTFFFFFLTGIGVFFLFVFLLFRLICSILWNQNNSENSNSNSNNICDGMASVTIAVATYML